MIKKKKF